MKKLFVIFILTLYFMCGTFIKVNACQDNEINMKNEIVNLITKAYEYRTKSIVNQSITDELGLFYVKGEKIYDFEKNRYQNYKKMENKLDLKIIDIKSSIKINDIEILSDNKAQVKLREIVSYKWLCKNDSLRTIKPNSSEMGIDHKITLVKEVNEWKIQKDEYTEGELTEVTSPDYKSPQVKISKMVNEVDIIVPYSIPGATYYNRNVAANYAETYWYNYNTNYRDYTRDGGDCANFVSQCLYAGGAYFIGFGNNSSNCWWYDNKNTSTTSDDVASTTWTYCPSQKPFILSGWGKEVNPTSLSRGDLVYYDWTGDGVWDHVAIVTGFDSSGTPLVTCHTTDYHNIKWNYGGSSCKYSCIHINDYI